MYNYIQLKQEITFAFNMHLLQGFVNMQTSMILKNKTIKRKKNANMSPKKEILL